MPFDGILRDYEPTRMERARKWWRAFRREWQDGVLMIFFVAFILATNAFWFGCLVAQLATHSLISFVYGTVLVVVTFVITAALILFDATRYRVRHDF